MKRILIIYGHPDPDRARYCYALGDAYKRSALQSGFQVKEIFVADLDFPLLRTKHDFNDAEPPEVIQAQQQLITWADHIVLIYPLWLGAMPALLKGFLEQTLRPSYAFGGEDNEIPKPSLKGKSARVVVTMGMPGFVYRWFFLAHSLRSLQRNILKFCGIRPVKTTVIGSVEKPDNLQHQTTLSTMHRLGDLGN